jgi:hypothetical protein
LSQVIEVAERPRLALYRGLRRVLSRPNADRIIIALAIALLGFSLDTGLSADDYIHKLIATGAKALPAFARDPLDMYRFTGGEQTRALMREGVLSWWEDPEAKLAFFRPLSALTHYVDYTLWPQQAWAMHLHSMLWSLLLYWGLLALYRALIAPPWVCALALFFYALDDGRGWFVSWIAARNAVIATAISIWALYFHHRARGGGTRAGQAAPPDAHARAFAWLAVTAFGLSLLASEGAASIGGYLFAYALLLDRGSQKARIASLMPYLGVTVVWRVIYKALGYGVLHSGLYFDPLHEPRSFLFALIERVPVLLFSQSGGPWSDAFSIMFVFPLIQQIVWTAAIVFVIALGWALWPLIARDKVVQFALIGAVLSLLPASATFMADRMLTWVAIGACIALAQLVATYIETPQALTATPLRALLVPAIVLFVAASKTIIDPLCLPSRARGNLIVRDSLDRAGKAVPKDPSIADKRVVYVNPAGVPLAGFILVERAGSGLPRPRSQVWLATAESEVRVERVDQNTLRVRQRGGFLLSPSSWLLRRPQRPFTLGTRVELDGLTIEVSDLMPDGRPAEILAHFDVPLEDPGLYWLQWGTTGYLPFKPPALHGAVTLPATDFVKVVLGDGMNLPIDGRLPAPVDAHWVTEQ